MTRIVELLLTIGALVVLSPVLLGIATVIKLMDGGPAFYRGVRAGWCGTPFRIYKFRTMVVNADSRGGPSAAHADPRITKTGEFLRKYKLDELPQLLNVLRGEMALVGPRPEVLEYVHLLTDQERTILSVKPGMTDWASLWNHDEGALLAGSEDPERVYLERIRPIKIRLQLKYVAEQSMWTDVRIVLQTLAVVMFRIPPKLTASVVKAVSQQAAHLPEPPVSTHLLSSLYRCMLRIRLFEETAARLVEAGEIRTPCHLSIGQEAIAAGVCAALEPRDYAWGGHRSHGHYLAKGGDLCAMMAELLGKSTGCSRGRGGSMHLIAPEVGILGTVPLVAATIPLAVGAALATKLRKETRVSVAFFGDGATEEGHFHESLNLAAVYRLPVIFVCENNFYASHLPLLARRAVDNVDQAASAHGVLGVRLDGNDVVAVYDATRTAVQRARNGLGPTLLECRTYRWRGHVGPAWDEDVGVKRRNELKDWLPRDPLPRAREHLSTLGTSPEVFEALERDLRAEVEHAVRFARQSPAPDEATLLRHVWV